MGEGPGGYVYFIRCTVSNRIKIGWSRRDPDGRFATICVSSADPLERFALMHGGKSHEGDLHDRFEAHWVKGEWFRYCDEILEYALTNARDWFDLLTEDTKRGLAGFSLGAGAIDSPPVKLERTRKAGRPRKVQPSKMKSRVRPKVEVKPQAVAKPKTVEVELRPDRPKRYGPLQALLDAAREETP